VKARLRQLPISRFRRLAEIAVKIGVNCTNDHCTMGNSSTTPTPKMFADPIVLPASGRHTATVCCSSTNLFYVTAWLSLRSHSVHGFGVRNSYTYGFIRTQCCEATVPSLLGLPTFGDYRDSIPGHWASWATASESDLSKSNV
jgi:hypothetical protein